MPCMCGDLQCPSCGPAQGNFKCPVCGAWADDCCEHFVEDADHNLIENPAFAAEFKAAAERERQEAEAEALMYEEAEKACKCVHCGGEFADHDYEDSTCPNGKNIFKSVLDAEREANNGKV